ncbi:MAG: DEAD/DEAH box helicase [Verrucomicrobia bacterium]|nr:DEAD/DEAH box helicase [Verrucomicrobiota bacterium]MDA1069233.1 DEAD/DEAH box helicase [Verrucomicrobiota bacterium]
MLNARSTAKKRTSKKNPGLPAATDWRTTDEQELLKRRIRAQEETFRITNASPEHTVLSNFAVKSASGLSYSVEIRDLKNRDFDCTCTDFRINGLGSCKHVEAVLQQLEKKHPTGCKKALVQPSPHIDIIPDTHAKRLKVERNLRLLPPSLRVYFDKEGRQNTDVDMNELVAWLRASSSKKIRLSQTLEPWLNHLEIERDRTENRRDYETGVIDGRHPEHVTLSPLFPYQREGMLHLAFKERALLADEMGLGKTIQAIAACALLHHLGKARRVLVVSPASLKTEWEEQINKFTTLPQRLVFGGPSQRNALYSDPNPPFFTICNYEQILRDSLNINASLRPDIIVLDEAQRIKNWSSKTAQAVKRLESRYAFVLTGTPLENRIDELKSIVDFLDPSLLGTLFRFNREYYDLDERGRPKGYKNLEQLRAKVAPVLLRRRKIQVETELPDRTDINHFVPLTKAMREEYAEYEKSVGELAAKAKRRPLTPKEQDLLMILLNMMRMICDSPGIIKKNPSRECPKLKELEGVLEDCLSDPDVKVIVFSEWIGMLERVRELAEKLGFGYAWHTGSVPQKKRRAEILAFRQDPDCRIFFSTDSGGVGLNLQNASVVINCDLPWNPAKLEQRIARAWRKNQTRPVTVINLVAEETIEHGMLASLAQKMELADGVLDGYGNLNTMTLKSGRQVFLKRLEQVMSKVPVGQPVPPAPPSDPAAHFAARAKTSLGPRLSYCEETWIPGSETPVLIAILHNATGSEKPQLEELFQATPWSNSAPVLQVLDAATWEALQSLSAAGMISIHTRASRPLLPEEGEALRPPLSPEELAKIKALRETAETKRRAAEALIAAGLNEEAEPFKTAAEEAEAEAVNIENHHAEKKEK